jgi:hypothetical protein
VVETKCCQDEDANVYRDHLHLEELSRFVLGNDAFRNNCGAYEWNKLPSVKQRHTILENHPRGLVLHLPTLCWSRPMTISIRSSRSANWLTLITIFQRGALNGDISKSPQNLPGCDQSRGGKPPVVIVLVVG